MRIAAILAGLMVAGTAAADGPPVGFTFTAGAAWKFTSRQTSTVVETKADDGGVLTAAKATTVVTLTRTFAVKTVNADGSATVELSFDAMRQELIREVPGRDGKPTEEKSVLDSAVKEDREQIAVLLGKPLLGLTIDARGAVTDVKQLTSVVVPTQIKAELPFRVLLPGKPVAANAAWGRECELTLDPPFGTGEAHAAKQTFTFRGANGPHSVFGVKTELKTPPAAPSDRQTLAAWLWEGDVFVDTATGRYAGAKLTTKTEIPNHAGDGSKFVYTSEFVEAVEK